MICAYLTERAAQGVSVTTLDAKSRGQADVTAEGVQRERSGRTISGVALMVRPSRESARSYFVRQMYTDWLVPSARFAKIRYSPAVVMLLVLQLYW